MSVEEFFDLLIEELKQNPKLKGYYRFLNDPGLFEFRKAYFCQRLEYIYSNIPKEKNCKIFDIGCGYGTTAIFLVLNGYTVSGGTLEYYYEQMGARMEYWSKIGNLSNLEIRYEDFYENPLKENNYDVIVAQDVLHHLEPIEKALQIISKSLVIGGKLISCEENGDNLINSFRLFLKRGNKRVIEYKDPTLNKTILMGNENIRSLKKWNKIISREGLTISENSVEYVRFYFPGKYKKTTITEIINKEQKLWKKSPFLRNNFFHGLNFVAEKTT